MAERSFVREVQQLRLGVGQEFRGAGILGITKALPEYGVGYIAGCQGTQIPSLMDVLAVSECPRHHPDAALWMRQPREAALKDDAGHALDDTPRAVASLLDERAAA